MMRIVCNGYIDGGLGSVAAASHMVLRELLERGHDITFVSKRSFIYPKDLLSVYPNLSFVDATNTWTNWAFETTKSRLGNYSLPFSLINHSQYAKGVMRQIRRLHAAKPFDAMLFLGLAAFQSIVGLKTVSWLQGPPGTDLRSLSHRREMLLRTEGRSRVLQLRVGARCRQLLNRIKFNASDKIIVGSHWAAKCLSQYSGIDPAIVAALPYPIDLSLFIPRVQPGPDSSALNVLWLGRIVPRKRLDLFLDAAALAHEQGIPLRIQIYGDFTFAPGMQKLISEFRYQSILSYTQRIPRAEVISVLKAADVLCQPSDEENFGSSVAEAMACGTPVIVGATNGTGDYLCSQSVRLRDDLPETLAAVFKQLYERKCHGNLIKVEITRQTAERNFSVQQITEQLENILK